MEIPFEPVVFGYHINVHLVMEYLAFFVGFRYYVFLRKRGSDSISNSNRLSIILAAIVGALVGSRIMGWLEHPVGLDVTGAGIIKVFNTKTIMGGLFGGLIGVELSKKMIGETHSSGDLFTLPIILGILIGRIGCFLSGTNEFTYGKPTGLFLGMDLGDGLLRHPLALYEIVFLGLLFLFLKIHYNNHLQKDGALFKYFMLSYFIFRFCMEFLKPNDFFIWGLSSIQWLCIICVIYYRKTIGALLQFKKP
ncbi:MAG: prolipoprotein diacylglyceryl transferase [Flavobacteriaceae bacterium]